MRKFQTLICLFALLLLPACSSVNPDTAWDPYFEYDGARTYDWAPKVPETGPDLPYDAIDRAVKRFVDSELQTSGYTRSSDNPVFRVTYYVGVEEIEALTNEAYYGPGWGAYWGRGWDGPIGPNLSLYDDGTVTVDIMSTDPAIGLVWRGIARAEITTAMSADRVESAVEGALEDLLEDFRRASAEAGANRGR